MAQFSDDLNLAEAPIDALVFILNNDKIKSKSKKEGVAKIITERHSSIFGPTEKQLALKIKDLKTQEVINKITFIKPDMLEKLRVKKILQTYFTFHAVGSIEDLLGTRENYLDIFDNTLKVLLLKYWKYMFLTKEEAVQSIDHFRSLILKQGNFTEEDDEYHEIQDQLHKSTPPAMEIPIMKHRNLQEYINMLINWEVSSCKKGGLLTLSPYYIKNPPVDFTHALLDKHIINDDEAALVRSLFSYIQYNIGGKLLDAYTGSDIPYGIWQNPQKIEGQRDKYRSYNPSCMYYGPGAELNESENKIKKLIHVMERTCSELNTSTYRADQFYEIRIELDSLPDILTPTKFAHIMRQISYQLSRREHNDISDCIVSFAVADQMGSDMGGVTRMVLYKLAECLGKILKKSSEGLYYLVKTDGSPLSIPFMMNVTLFIKLVVLTNTKVDLPLNYGTIYMLTNRIFLSRVGDNLSIKDPWKLNLDILMALYNMQNPTELKSLISLIGMSDEDMEEYLPMYLQSTQSTQSAQKGQTSEYFKTSQVPQAVEHNQNTRLAWLQLTLYKKLFHPYSEKPPVIHLDNVISSSADNRWFPYGVQEFASYFKIPLNSEVMLQIPIISSSQEDDPIIERNIEHVKRFIVDNPTRWEIMLVFIHGSLRTEKEITINKVSGGLPVAHTCFGSLDLRPYTRYEDFERDFILAIENTSGLHIV
jgi:hypothetical protein